VRKEELMSGGISGQISKGIVHQKVDHVLNHGNRATFLAGLKRANTAEKYLDLLQKTDVMGPDVLTPEEALYLKNTWYNEDPKTGWWWQAQPIYPILHKGLLKTIVQANAAGNLPIDSYWLPVTTGSLVAVLVAVGEYQVTRIIITPLSPYLDALTREPVSIWEIKRGHDGHSGPGGDEDPEPQPFLDDDIEALDESVKVWRRKERPRT
jgi:hypothetical protein